jgi:hypothetical protein
MSELTYINQTTSWLSDARIYSQTTQIHLIHMIQTLRGGITFLCMIHFVIGNEDYIQMAKILKTPKWDFKLLLKLPNYEAHYFASS